MYPTLPSKCMAELGQELRTSDLISKINAVSLFPVIPRPLTAPLRPPYPPPALGPTQATWFCPGKPGCKGQTGLPPAFQLPLGTQLSAGPREPKATSQAGPHNWYIVNSKQSCCGILGKPQSSLGLGFFIWLQWIGLNHFQGTFQLG